MLNDVLLECGIADFSVMGNKLIIRDEFKPINQDAINEFDASKLSLFFMSGVYTGEELPSSTRIVEGKRAVFKFNKTLYLERVKSQHQTRIKGRGAKESSLVVNHLKADSLTLLGLAIRDSCIIVKAFTELKSVMIENSKLDTKDLVLNSVNIVNTEIRAECLLICGETKCDSLTLEDSVSLVLQDSFRGVIKLPNSLQFLFIDMRLKSKDSTDIKIIGHVENLSVYLEDSLDGFEEFSGFSDLTWDKSYKILDDTDNRAWVFKSHNPITRFFLETLKL